MPTSQRLYVVSPPGAHREALLAALGTDVVAFASVADIGILDDPEQGIILVDHEGVPAEDILTLLIAASTPMSDSGWCVAIVRDDEGEVLVQTLSLGPDNTVSEVGEYARDPDVHRGRLLELKRVLREAGRLRHDLNNPLTSALAETQILLMDAHEVEVQESLEVIQAQLRRIRDLIAGANHLRIPRRLGS